MKDFFDAYAQRIRRGAEDECWEWVGTRSTAGYGNFGRGGRRYTTHRCAYEAKNGAGSAVGWVVRHRCDNPPCVNPSHLLIGTHADNARDAMERGRLKGKRGETSVHATLTEEAVLRFRRLAREGATLLEITRGYPECGRQGITDAIKGKTWAHLAGAVAHPKQHPVRPPRLVGSEHPRSRLDEDQVRGIKRRLAAGETCAAVAGDFSMSRVAINNIRLGKTWTHV